MPEKGDVSVSIESVLDIVRKQRNEAFDAVSTLTAYIEELRREVVELREQVAKFEAERDTQDRGKHDKGLVTYEDAR
ncbi:MAG TPA: hypothetical protein VLA68_03690 [Nitrososphaera sp.]|nr:hypothetical protein [Nitrososphaera sp.]